jgi:PleD family two-component response regulator
MLRLAAETASKWNSFDTQELSLTSHRPGAASTMSPNPDILVVDDRLLDANETLVALEQVAPRARVLHLESSNEALEYLFSVGAYAGRPSTLPQLVLLSAQMSHASALCLLDLMRAHTLTNAIPIILVSHDNDMRRSRRHDQFDADAYVTRPADFQRYCTLLEDCVMCWVPSTLRPSGSRYFGRETSPIAAPVMVTQTVARSTPRAQLV